MKWLIISGHIKKEKHRKFYCFHNTSRWHFVNPSPPGNLQLHSKIYVLVSIRDAVLRLPWSVAPGSWSTGTSSKTQVLEVFPSISLPPSHNSTVPDKTLAHTGPRAEECLGLCLLDSPMDHQILPTLSVVVSLDFFKIINFPLTPCLCVCSSAYFLYYVFTYTEAITQNYFSRYAQEFKFFQKLFSWVREAGWRRTGLPKISLCLEGS